MQSARYATPWRKFSLRLTALIIIAVVGGWAMSAVFASKPVTVGVGAPMEASAAISPMELMATHGRAAPGHGIRRAVLTRGQQASITARGPLPYIGRGRNHGAAPAAQWS